MAHRATVADALSFMMSVLFPKIFSLRPRTWRVLVAATFVFATGMVRAEDPPAEQPAPDGTVTGGPATIGLTPEDVAKNMVSVPGKHFKISKYEVTRAQFEQFAKATNHDGFKCRSWDGTILNEHPKGAYNTPGFAQTMDDPVVCMSYEDAEAYLKWLNETAKPPRPYRLPKDSEWIYAATQGASMYPWGTDTFEKGKANCLDALCADGNQFTTPVGKFPPNKLGIYDMAGNVWEWTTGCFLGDCKRRIILGGSWISPSPDQMRIDYHWGNSTVMRTPNIGLRIFQDE